MATQTGSIDLTASNGVKLMAEAGFESIEENYATKAELDVQADRIGMVVANNDASSSLQLTADAMTYIGNNVTIKGTDGTSTVISGGQIQTGSLSIGAFDSAAQSATLNSNINVGGRNWLLDTGTFNDWYRDSVVTASDGITTFPSRSSLSWICTRHLTIPAADFFGNTWTFSFDYRSDDFSSTSGNRYIDVNIEAGATYNARSRTKYCGLNVPSVSGAANTWVPTTEWQRGSVSFTPADESFLNRGSGDVNYVGITIWSYTLNSFQVRRMKLEKGNAATDWSPAPEDMASSADSVEFISGTQTAATNAWTGVTKDTSLSTGKMIAYYLPYAGTSSAATLNLTLSDSTTTGAKSVKFNSNNSASNNVTTQYGVGSVIYMTYDGTYWRVAASYYDTGGITNARYRTQNPNAIKAAEAITAAHIICGTSSGYKNIATGVTFDLSYPLLYATSAIASGSTGTSNYLTYNGVNVTNNGSITGATSNAMVFLKGTVSGNTFAIAASGFITCTVPNSDDGYAYIPLGILYNGTTSIYFSTSKDLYAYKDGAFGPVSIREASAAAKTATSYVTEITGQNGIMVHPSTDDDTGVRITSDVDIMRDGYSVINVGTQGDTSGNTDAGVTIYDGTTNENVVATFDGDGIGLVGGAFRLTSERVTEEYGDESNPTTSTEIRSTINTETSNDSYATRCFLRSGLTEGDAAGGGFWELASETDINPEFPTDTKNASVEVGSDPWGSSIRLVADSQELSLSKNPMDNKDYFTLTSEVFLLTDYHNGVNMWSTAPGTVLWSGGWHMTVGHTANLKYNVSTCPTGIVLHFQPYTNSTIRNWNHIYYFVPKEHVASYNGSGIVVRLGNPDFSNLASKYLYISNDHITGNDQNNTSGTNSGITYNNAAWVMTQVIAV